jgi:hypothetical protein
MRAGRSLVESPNNATVAVLLKIAFVGLVALSMGNCGSGTCDSSSAQCVSAPNSEVVFGVTAADFDGDGHPDVAIPVTTLASGVVGVYLHSAVKGDTYADRVDYLTSAQPFTILSADLNGDNNPDLVTTDSRDGLVGVLLNTPSAPGTFGAPQLINIPGSEPGAVQYMYAAAADLKGNGLPDLLVTSGVAVLLLPQLAGAPGTFGSPVVLFSGTAALHSLALGDLNGDGTPDIALVDDAGVTLLFTAVSNGTVTITGTTSVYTNSKSGAYPAVAIADLNGDGRNDVVIADPIAGTLTVLLQSQVSAGQFLPAAHYPLPAGTGLSIVVADLNADKRPDLVIGGSALVAVLLQDPAHSAAFLPTSTYAAPIGANAVAIADVNGDGLPDIVTDSGVSSTVVNGVLRTPPGVLLQDPGKPGTFMPLKNLD